MISAGIRGIQMRPVSARENPESESRTRMITSKSRWRRCLS